MLPNRKRRWFSQLNYDEQLLTAFTIIGSVSAFAINWVAHIADEGSSYMLVNYLLCALLLAAVPLLLITRRYQLAANYFLMVGFAWMCLSLIDFPTIENNYLYWFSCLPLVGGLMNRYSGLILGTIFALLGLFVFVYNSFLILPIEILMSGTVFILPVSSFLIFTLMMGLLTTAFIKVNEANLQSNTKKLNTLLKIVSHDITNPLTLIRGLADLLQKNSSLDQVAARQVHKIFFASDTIHRILERVRHIQAIKSGILQVRKVPTSIQEAVASVKYLNELELQRKKLRLCIELPEYDMLVLADPVTFTNEVLNNLISNAIKFSPARSQIKITAKHQGSWVVVTVSDQGIGIPKSMQQDVFDEFKLTTREGTEGERGTGFGLPLVKNLIEAYGGYLELESYSIESHPNRHGTTLTLYLPSASVPAKTAI